jgi:hypothetical protein
MKKYLPRFTLRDVFWLLLVVAVSIGWWRDRTQLAADRDSVAMNLQTEQTLAQFTEVQSKLDNMQIGSLTLLLSNKTRELAKLDYAIKQLDKETRESIFESARIAPMTDEFAPSIVVAP